MKYRCYVEINLPLDRVIDLFDNPENLKEWMPGLISFETFSGTSGQPGAKSRLKYKMGKREVEMIETIITRNLPEEFSGTYEAKGVFNYVKTRFEAIGTNKTRLTSEQEFRFSGFMKLMAWIMPGMFKKQTQKYLEMFKAFAESRA